MGSKAQKARARKKRAAAKKRAKKAHAGKNIAERGNILPKASAGCDEDELKSGSTQNPSMCADIDKLAADVAALCTTSTDSPPCKGNDTSSSLKSSPKLRNVALQKKLNDLKKLLRGNEIEKFVEEFVPLDLSSDDRDFYTTRLMSDEIVGRKGETELDFLKAEIDAIADGKITFIDGDYEGSQCITFTFVHPIEKRCDREVTFSLDEVSGEWRADA